MEQNEKKVIEKAVVAYVKATDGKCINVIKALQSVDFDNKAEKKDIRKMMVENGVENTMASRFLKVAEYVKTHQVDFENMSWRALRELVYPPKKSESETIESETTESETTESETIESETIKSNDNQTISFWNAVEVVKSFGCKVFDSTGNEL